MELFAFYAFALLTCLSALMMLFSRDVLYTAFFLLFALLGMSALYVFAGADFLALAQILIYVGGVLVLLMFGIMLTKREQTSSKRPNAILSENRRLGIGLGLGALFFTALLWLIREVKVEDLAWQKEAPVIERSTVNGLGIGLMTDYLLAFELIAVLLLVALIGATFIAGKDRLKTP